MAMQKKIRTGQLQQYNFIFVVGAQEIENKSVNLRDRDDQSTQSKGEMITIEDVTAKLERLRDERVLSTIVAASTTEALNKAQPV